VPARASFPSRPANRIDDVERLPRCRDVVHAQDARAPLVRRHRRPDAAVHSRGGVTHPGQLGDESLA